MTYVVVIVLTLTRIIKSVVTRQAPSSHLGVEEYPRKKTQTKQRVVHASIIIPEAIHPCLCAHLVVHIYFSVQYCNADAVVLLLC